MWMWDWRTCDADDVERGFVQPFEDVDLEPFVVSGRGGQFGRQDFAHLIFGNQAGFGDEHRRTLGRENAKFVLLEIFG